MLWYLQRSGYNLLLVKSNQTSQWKWQACKSVTGTFLHVGGVVHGWHVCFFPHSNATEALLTREPTIPGDLVTNTIADNLRATILLARTFFIAVAAASLQPKWVKGGRRQPVL